MFVLPSGGRYAVGDGGAPTVVITGHSTLLATAVATLLTGPPLEATVRIVGVHQTYCSQSKPTDPIPDILVELDGSIMDLHQLNELVRTSRHSRVVLLLDRVEHDLVKAALDSGVAGLLTMDSAVDELVVSVRAVLNGYTAIGARVMERLLAHPSPFEGSNGEAGAGPLSATEYAVLKLLAEARPVRAIATLRGISQKTVRNHLASIYRKLEVRNRAGAMLYAVRAGIIDSTNGTTPSSMGIPNRRRHPAQGAVDSR